MVGWFEVGWSEVGAEADFAGKVWVLCRPLDEGFDLGWPP